jgi:hypothetical protein
VRVTGGAAGGEQSHAIVDVQPVVFGAKAVECCGKLRRPSAKIRG